MKTAVKQSWRYRLLAWFGSQIYNIRLRMENLNDWVDRMAGQYWDEENS